jgi:hypothetical protein
MNAGTAIAAVGLMGCLPLAANAEPYVSAQLGLANVEWPQGSPVNGTIDDRGFGYGVDVGFGFGRRWAVELGAYGYEDFDARGTPCAPGATCSGAVTEFGGNAVSLVKVALAPRFTIGEVRLFATMGFYRAKIDVNVDAPDTRLRDEGAVLGLGARWYFADPWSVSVQATRFDDNLRQIMFGVGWGLRKERHDSYGTAREER